MSKPSCQHAERLLSAQAAGQLQAHERLALEAHLSGCASCAGWAAQHETLVQQLKGKATPLSPEKLATMRALFLAAPAPRPALLTRPRALGVLALAASVLLVMWVAPLLRGGGATSALLSGLGPHQGLLLEKDGSRVELVTSAEGAVAVYLFDTNGNQHRASGEVKMLIAEGAFAPTEATLVPAEDGSYLVGHLPAGHSAAEVTLVFPSGAEFVFSGVALVEPVTMAVAPPVEVVMPGGVAVLDDKHRVEAEVLAKGEVRVRAYGEGAALASSEFSIPALTLEHGQKKYPVKLTAKDGYWVGFLASPVELKAGAQVSIICNAPLEIRGVIYEPARVVFTRYALAVSVKVAAPTIIVPTVIIKYDHPGKGHPHSHKKKSHK